jgi:3-phosphoshikimate 1-carboxyvinyltransferase
MKQVIRNVKISGEIKAPSSKSEFQRALAISLLSNGKSCLKFSHCLADDVKSAINIIESLGAEVNINNNEILIKGGINIVNNNLNVGESGLGIRMFTPIACLSNSEILITGLGSLKIRPIGMLIKPLKSLGVSIKTNNGLLPIKVSKSLLGGNTELDGSVSSQFLTGLLIALPKAKNDSIIKVGNLKSIPYIEMTIDILSKAGIQIKHESYKIFKIKGNQIYKPLNINIEGDWSGAAFMAVAGAIGGNISISNLNANSKQADVKILEALRDVGAHFSFNATTLNVKKVNLKAFSFDATHCPDLFPPLVVLAANCKGISKIKGVNRLTFKESNRAEVLKSVFLKLGINITIKDDIMVIIGGAIKGTEVSSHNDHRIAMAVAIAGINSTQDISITDSECISKSYPEFFYEFEKVILK